jgi:Ras-related protein Rab-1A
VVLVLDLTNRSSFEGVEKWMEDVNTYGPKDCVIIIVGNKSDLDDDRQVSYTEAYNLAKKYDTVYIEVSAKTGYNVLNVFEELTKMMIRKEDEDNEKKWKNKGKSEKNYSTFKKSIKLDEESTDQKRGCCN